MLQSQGNDIYGEARLVDAMAGRGSTILDAGCGTGRLGAYLIKQGHTVVGTDIDPVLIEHAKRDVPEARFYVGDLSADEIPVTDVDIAVSAGNVMGFLAPDGRDAALANIFRSLKPKGRAVIGFGAGRGWGFDDFLDTARRAGFAVDAVFESWDLNPFTEESTFLVALLSKPA
ncbi:Methyltransferase domain [Corynebacterium uterequi]|uniref:Methyltransferase domain n=2 Tax=Corynebacterium uterequi TaxID=1072256 RepID=A0A0G3HGJ4_9CORY|nr:Methyltransferase domain [Corynebacterium uterequi]